MENRSSFVFSALGIGRGASPTFRPCGFSSPRVSEKVVDPRSRGGGGGQGGPTMASQLLVEGCDGAGGGGDTSFKSAGSGADTEGSPRDRKIRHGYFLSRANLEWYQDYNSVVFDYFHSKAVDGRIAIEDVPALFASLHARFLCAKDLPSVLESIASTLQVPGRAAAPRWSGISRARACCRRAATWRKARLTSTSTSRTTTC